MRYNIFTIVLTTVFAWLGGCQQPEDLRPSVSREGVNSITATFPDGTGGFSGTISEDGDEIIIPIPYYYPENSNDRVTEEDITHMRVKANLDDNVVVNPSLLYMDLTKDNKITVIDQKKGVKEYVVRGEIRKLSSSKIEEFEIPSLGLSGVINEETKTISLIAVEAIDPALADVSISSHATISPDPNVEELDYNNDVQLTVTAHDGVTQTVYTVKKEIPEKLPYGIRAGSAKLLFAKHLKTDLGITVDHVTGGIAATREYVVLNTRGENSININALTGEKVGEIDLGTVKGNLTNFYNTADDDGNILLNNLAPNDGSFKVWKIISATSVPELMIEWNDGEAIGRKLSVQGSIDSDAIISAPIYGTAQQRIARWTVVGGVLTSQTPEIVQMSGLPKGWTTNADVVYTSSTDTQSDYFVSSYSDNSFAWVDGTSNTVMKLLDPINANFIQNAVDYVEFNNASYTVTNYVNSQPWGSADQVWLLDVSSDALFEGSLTEGTVESVIWQSEMHIYGQGGTEVRNTNGTGDVALTVSSNGYYMYVYFMFTNGYVVGYQFDCIDM